MAEEAKTAAKRNELEADKIASFVSRIENLHKDLDTERAEYMNRCAAIREDIKEVLGEAKDAGLSKGAVKAVVKIRELERKAEAVREDSEYETQNEIDMIRSALGDLADTPLGRAAQAAAE